MKEWLLKFHSGNHFFIPVAKNDTGRDLPLQGKK